MNSDTKGYEVVITGNPDGQAIMAIKKIREAIGLDLKEAKFLFDNIPCVVIEGLSRDDAEDYAGKLKCSSLSVEIRENEK